MADLSLQDKVGYLTNTFLILHLSLATDGKTRSF